MHENRELSCTSWSSDQERSAKAINRKADTNVQEKSDCAVAPVNQPNDEGQQPSAEAGEGRVQTEENIVQSHMRPTQSGKRMSQGLHQSKLHFAWNLVVALMTPKFLPWTLVSGLLRLTLLKRLKRLASNLSWRVSPRRIGSSPGPKQCWTLFPAKAPVPWKGFRARC
jgi:hypothetical protein